jgi:hypothetical protein
MEFYRFQMKSYEVNKNSQSYGWAYDNLEEAMVEDISMCQKNAAQAVNDTIEELEKMVGKDSEIYKNIVKKSWWNLVENYDMEHHNAQMGISCYTDPDDLYNYFCNERFGFCPGGSEDEYYILHFEGRWLETGCDGEDIAE